MGWWSDSILGGDTPMDYLDEICAELFFNIPDFDSSEIKELNLPGRTDLAKSLDLKFWNTITDTLSKMTDFPEDANIYAQVIAVLAMELGAEIPQDFKENIAIPAGEHDDWAKSSDSRRGQILAYLDALNKYEPGHPVTLPGDATWHRIEDKKEIPVWQVTRIWQVEAETAQEAIALALPDEHQDVIVRLAE